MLFYIKEKEEDQWVEVWSKSSCDVSDEIKQKLFNLGMIVATNDVLDEYVNDYNFLATSLRRHCSGDFGDLCEEDVTHNLNGIVTGERILSSYSGDGGKIWIITEADRSSTTILTPDEY